MIYLLLTIQRVITAATPWLASAAVVLVLMALGARLVERGARCEALSQFKRLGLLWQIAIVLSVGSATRWAGAKGDRGGGTSPSEPHVVRGILIGGDGGQLRGGTDYTLLSATDTQAFSNLAFCAISASSTNIALAATWATITNRQEAIDVYMRTNLVAGTWGHLAEVAIDTASQGISFDVPAEWLDGAPVVFFRLGSRLDSDCDGLPDSLETLVCGSDPNLADSDGDGLQDGGELAIGTNPASADTDCDGLDDGEELSWHVVETNGLARWIDIPANVYQSLLFADNDDSVTNFSLPFGVRLFEGSADKLSVNVNGLVALSAQGDAIDSGHYSNHEASCIPVGPDPSATIAAFWDDLLVHPDMGSYVSFATVGDAGARTAIVEFHHVGFFDADTNSFVSIQVQFPETESNVVRVVFAEASGCGAGLSATLGMRTSRDESVEHSYDTDGAAFPGLAITYHIGFGTNPTVADSDGDGVSDGEEVSMGANPADMDTDGDGLTDGEELDLGTDPLDPDTDDDRLSDGWEIEDGFDPLDPDDGASDADDDGLTFAQEYLDHGTDPDCWDSDGDGLSDGDEITAGTDPLDEDTDSDELPDGFEVQIGTDPILPDSDRDRLPDGWEHFHAPFDPLDATDGAADADLDGLSNAVEILDSHTDMNLTDTDNDELSDYLEWNGLTDPLTPDTDGDGLLDGEEADYGTEPWDADFDDDGCPDGWEVQYGFNPLLVSSPNLWADPDMDGIRSGEEARLGTSPLSADTDGDGLPDAAESTWHMTTANGPSRWLDIATNSYSALVFTNADEGVAHFAIPFAVEFAGMSATNLSISANGLVALAENFPALAGDDYGNGPAASIPLGDTPCATIAAFWDDLVVSPDMGSTVLLAISGEEGSRTAIVEFSHVGFYNGSTNDFVSFQVQFSEMETNLAYVVFSERSGLGQGDSATLGFRTSRGDLTEYACNVVGSVFPGLVVTYHFGLETDALNADTDDDGLEDGAEAALGTDPLNPDTDGDGLSDSEEQSFGTNPLATNSGNYTASADLDGDGLTNGQELLLGTDPGVADTDGDGVSDGAEWLNGTAPLDDADSTPRETVQVAIEFGDQSGSHSEKYEVTLRPVYGDPRPSTRLINRQFGAPDILTAYLVSNAVYEVSMRHITTNMEDGEPDLDYTLTITPSGASADLATLVIDPDEIIGTKDDRPSVSWFSGKKAIIAVVKARILADLNRDGAIDEADAAINAPLRMWVNDDHDSGAIADGESDVPDGGGKLNHKNDVVNGIGDLGDFFPVWLDFGEAIETLRRFDPSARIEMRVPKYNARVNFVATDLCAAEAGKYLRDVSTAQSLSASKVQSIGKGSKLLPQSILNTIEADHRKGVLIIEGRGNSSRDLTVQLMYDGIPAIAPRHEVKISPVEDFYRWINIREAGGRAAGRPTDFSMPDNFPAEMFDGTNVVFLHGFRVTANGARGWSAEMFKRLWQSGCNSAFWAVTWRGDDGIVKDGGMNYHGNAVHAFETVPALANAMQPISGPITIIAHSLGTMVVSSAIQDHGFRPSKFFMLNSAVPVEAFDATQWNTDETDNPFEFEDWVGYPSNSWASCWHTLFPTNDIRSKLTWKGRFADVPQLTTLYNYYSTGDEVLHVFETPDSDGSGKITITPFGLGGSRYHSWQKQERFKGRWLQSALGGWGGTSEMGWGFSTQGYYANGTPPFYQSVYNPIDPDNLVIVRTVQYGADAALAASSEQLRVDPVFNHEPPEVFSSNLRAGDIDVLLARGLPALSGPAGSSPLSKLPADNNNDLNGNATPNSWPRQGAESWNGWRHSDIKAVALPFMFSVFQSFHQADNEQ